MSSVRTVNIGRSRPRGAGFPCSCGCGRLSRQACQTLLGEVGEDVPQPADDALARLFGRAVGEVFADIYGEHYSKASISRMLDYLRKDVTEWLERSLESYYPVVFIDCVHIKISGGVHRLRAHQDPQEAER